MDRLRSFSLRSGCAFALHDGVRAPERRHSDSFGALRPVIVKLRRVCILSGGCFHSGSKPLGFGLFVMELAYGEA